MDALARRVQDVEVDANFNPIHGLRDGAVASLGEAVAAAAADPEFATCDFAMNVDCARMFADDLEGDDGLSKDEVAVIHLYTQDSPFYRILNTRLRDRDRERLRPFFPLTRLLLSALYKLPVVAPQTVFRGIKADVREHFKPGKRKLWWAFSSTTTMIEVLKNEQFVGTQGQRTMFTIAATTAYDISRYSAIGCEHEVLLPPGSKLVVESTFSPAPDYHIVQLRQLDYTYLLPGFSAGPAHIASPRSSVSAAAGPMTPGAGTGSFGQSADVFFVPAGPLDVSGYSLDELTKAIASPQDKDVLEACQRELARRTAFVQQQQQAQQSMVALHEQVRAASLRKGTASAASAALASMNLRPLDPSSPSGGGGGGGGSSSGSGGGTRSGSLSAAAPALAAVGRQLRELRDGVILSVTVAPDGAHIVSGSNDKLVRVWDLATGALLRELKGHGGPITAVSVRRDSAAILSASNDCSVRLWELASGKALKELKGHGYSVHSVCFSPDGAQAVSGSSDRTVRVWDLAAGAQALLIKGHTDGVRSVAVTRDARFIVSGSWDRTVRVWDLKTGARVRELRGHGNGVVSVCVSPDSRFIVSGSFGKIVRVWDLQSGEQVRELGDHGDPVYSVAFSPDGRQIVTGASDRVLRVWDLARAEQVRVLKGHTAPIYSVAVAPDGTTVLSSSADGTIRIWGV